MKDEIIKQILNESLESMAMDSKDFNKQIIQRLNLKHRKQHSTLFNEKTIVNWFLFVSSFVLVFNILNESKPNMNVLLIGTVVCVIPIFLLIFNKIYLIKTQKN